MEQYTTKCGVVLPQVDGAKNYPLILYKVSPEWDEFLRCTSPNKVTIDDDFIKRIAQAACTMYATGGIGIAANQLGFKQNWCIIDTKWTKTGIKVPRVIINPDVVTSLLIETEEKSLEGCLSVPLGFKGTVLRHSAVSLNYTDLYGNSITWDATGLDACAVLHELDHLRGRLFIDHISSLRRHILEKKLVKVHNTVKHKIKNHNKQIIAQVNKLNQMAAFGYRPKEEPLVVEQPEEIELEQVSDIEG